MTTTMERMGEVIGILEEENLRNRFKVIVGGSPLSQQFADRAQFVTRHGKPVFRLTENVYLSQGDIRQVQLAKGAVRAGIDILLQRNGLRPADVDRALIAGSFGYHLTVRSLIDIELFPPEFDGKVRYVGNTSRSGGHDHHNLDHNHGIRAFCLWLKQPLHSGELRRAITALMRAHGEKILRIKGLLSLPGETSPTALHGIGDFLHPLEPIPHWPSADHRSRIVFIVDRLTEAQIAPFFEASGTHSELEKAVG